jgi:hypothetical protein
MLPIYPMVRESSPLSANKTNATVSILIHRFLNHQECDPRLILDHSLSLDKFYSDTYPHQVQLLNDQQLHYAFVQLEKLVALER